MVMMSIDDLHGLTFWRNIMWYQIDIRKQTIDRSGGTAAARKVEEIEQDLTDILAELKAYKTGVASSYID